MLIVSKVFILTSIKKADNNSYSLKKLNMLCIHCWEVFAVNLVVFDSLSFRDSKNKKQKKKHLNFRLHHCYYSHDMQGCTYTERCDSVCVSVSINAKYWFNGTLWNCKCNGRNGYWTHFVAMGLAMKMNINTNATLTMFKLRHRPYYIYL